MESDSVVSGHHRKIELQAPEDLTYLLANVRRAAAARIDEAFPPVEGAGEDELRTRIEELVGEYITKTFTLASPNMSINGMPLDDLSPISANPNAPADPSQPEVIYAPFDARARARVEELTREEEDLLREIAALKKSVPAAAAATWGESVKASLKEDEEALAARKDGVSSEVVSGVEINALERQQDVERSYEKAVEGLGRLKREMPAVVARMERARGAGGYVVTERR